MVRTAQGTWRAASEDSEEEESSKITPADTSTSSDPQPESKKPASEETSKEAHSNKRKDIDDRNIIIDARPTKRVRGVRGILKDVVDMPLDVLFEIFGRLGPLDLWHLAQTSQDLRGILMSRSSTSIWKQARLSHPGIPECPEDLSEPQYAVLLFGKHCFECLRNVSTHTLWDARVRLCTRCAREICSNSESRLGYFLEDLVPSIWVKYSGQDRELYYRPLARKWKKISDAFEEQSERTAWTLELAEERRIISEHAEACETWSEARKKNLDIEKIAMFEQRKKFVIERVKKLGWADELVKSPKSLDSLLDSSLVKKACQKDLTTRALSNLQVYINEFMTEVQSTRIMGDQCDLLRERLPILKSVHDDCSKALSPNILCPSAGELARIPRIMDLLLDALPNSSTGFTKEHLQPIVDSFPELILEWKQESDKKLLKLITNAYDPGHVINKNIFDLATTFFSCSDCNPWSYSPIRYPRILIHRCLRAVGRLGEGHESMIHKVLHEGTGNKEHIKFNLDHVKFLGDIVELCGFDRHTTTANEMDDANPILECLTCHDCHTGRAAMSWMNVIAHQSEYHGKPRSYGGQTPKPMLLKLVDEGDAVIARQELARAQEKHRALPSTRETICASCHLIDCSVNLRMHFKKEHGRAPTVEDILPLVDCNPKLLQYRLWPPRDADDHALVTGTEFE